MKYSSTLLCGTLLVSPLAQASDSFADLDLESLMSMDVQVTSAMKRAQSSFDTASSIYVLRGDRITHSGATSIPEALKMVPGLIVRQLDNNQWAITTRGIASRFSSKMLVMIDGQSLYTPKFSAVYWETLNVPLYDIERIEVIRGQGGILWGSNANNGVINIITKASIDSRGFHADATTGDKINIDANLRYGDDIGKKSSYRLYGHFTDVNESDKGVEVPPVDTTQQYSFGGRFDYTHNDAWFSFIQFDTTESELGQNYRGVIDSSNENIKLSGIFERTDTRVMARVENRMSENANQMLQLSWLDQSGTQVYLKEEFSSFDIDYQMNFVHNQWQFDWGGNYRKSHIHFDDSLFINSDEEIEHLEQFGGFAQVQYNLIPDKLNIIMGAKTEHNELTHWETQPLVRMLWKPQTNRVFWASASRSSRIPSLIEFNDNYAIQGRKVSEVFPTTTGIDAIDEYHIRTFLNGNNQVESEKTTSYELGYRESRERWSFDLSMHHTQSDNVAVININPNSEQFIPVIGLLQTGQIPQALQALQSTTINFDIVSTAEMTTYGADATLTWQPSDVFNAELGYSYTDVDYDLPEDTFPAIGRDSITSQIFLKTDLHLFEDHNLFATLRVEDGEAYQTDDFTALDITWSWRVSDDWSLALSGKNLFAGTHLEYNNTQETFTIANYIDESVNLKVTVEF